MLRRVFLFFFFFLPCVLLMVDVGMVHRPNYHAWTNIEDKPRIYRAVALGKPDLTVWVISPFSHREQGHEGEEIAAKTGPGPASFLSCTEYNHFHNITQSYLVTRSLETFPSHLYSSFWERFILNGC